MLKYQFTKITVYRHNAARNVTPNVSAFIENGKIKFVTDIMKKK